MQKPSLGRVVIVPMDPALNNGADEAPAIITRVWSDTMVNVRVLTDSGEHRSQDWRTSVSLRADKPEKPAHDAWWPPRV
jgi:hypothetical protein